MAHSIAGANLYEPHGEVPTKIWLLLPLRLYVGAYFILASLGKVSAGFLSNGDKLVDTFRHVIEGQDYPFGFYHAFYTLLINPHAKVFAFLVVFGELMTGLALVTGTLTRLACYGGIFMMLNFFLAFNPPLSPAHNTATFAVIMLVFILTGAGRAYGVDHYIHKKVPAWMA